MAAQGPSRIGKYELIQFLGGGMSHVYRARDTVLGRIVAVKILTEAGCADAEAKGRFLHEARMAGNIVHDNIIAVYDFGEEGGRPFMVMEFLTGESLRDTIKNGHAGSLHERLGIALQVANALGYIHSKKIIHRDVKPENIYVQTGGKVKLMDFGIAKSEGISFTRKGFTLGTPYYMAPEQILGQPVTPLVDIYAFGILLFEVLTGVKPVTAESVDKIFEQVLHQPLNLEPLRAMNAPAGVVELVNRCTSKTPAERPQNFDVVAHELERILASLTPPAVAEAVPAPLRNVPPVAPPAPVRRPAAPQAMPRFLTALPPRLRTQGWLMTISAVSVFAILSVLYVTATLFIR